MSVVPIKSIVLTIGDKMIAISSITKDGKGGLRLGLNDFTKAIQVEMSSEEVAEFLKAIKEVQKGEMESQV